MTIVLTYDGSAVTHKVKPSSISLASAAEDGEASMSGFDAEDPASDFITLGHRPFVMEESQCTQPRLFTGWTTARDLGRSDADTMIVGTARQNDVTVIDLNALFNFRMISGADGNRPAETWAARINWLLGSDYLSGLIADTGFIVSNTTAMDAADYRDGYPADVLRDLMDRSANAYTYFAFWDAAASAVGLWVGHLDAAISDSTLRISNVRADVDNVTTFFPDEAANLSVTPTETYSEVVVEYGHGTKRLFRSRASTATKYIRRGTKITRPYTGSASTANTQAQRFLDQHANEQDRITVTIQVPKTAVGLVTAGQRMDVKFSHLTGYTSFTSMRVVRLTVSPVNDVAAFYMLTLELLAPRAAVPGSGTSSVIQVVTVQNANVDATITATLPATPTAGNLLVAHYSSRGTTLCATPAGWTRGPDFSGPAFDGGNSTLFYKTAGAAESASLTITKNAGNYAALTFAEVGQTGAFDTSGFANAVGATTALSAGPLAATTGAIAVFAAFNQSARAGTPFTFGSGYTMLGEAQVFTSGPAVCFGWKLVNPASGTQTATATSSESDGYGWGMLSFVANADIEITLPPPPGVTAIIDQINNLEYLGDIPLGLPEL
uniref:Uncharacterized protein n=1 Tax=viral metagenome TaxID=1070528 RepID=A0A6M3L3W8_9ZZZZ